MALRLAVASRNLAGAGRGYDPHQPYESTPPLTLAASWPLQSAALRALVAVLARTPGPRPGNPCSRLATPLDVHVYATARSCRPPSAPGSPATAASRSACETSWPRLTLADHDQTPVLLT